MKDGIDNSLFTGLAQDISRVGESFAVSSINSVAQGLIGPSFSDDINKNSLGLAAESAIVELMKSDTVTGLTGLSFAEDLKKWEDAMSKTLTPNPYSEMEAKPFTEPMLIIPEKIEYEIPDLPLIPPISREVILSEEKIERLACKLAEKGGRVTVIAKNKGVAIMGNALSDMINTGDHISDKKSE